MLHRNCIDESDAVSHDRICKLFIERCAAEDRLRYQPVIIEQFLDKEADRGICNENMHIEKHVHDESVMHERFVIKLQRSSKKTSVYTSFTSRVDWELTQWVKTRGPGATTLNELLFIEGVRHLS